MIGNHGVRGKILGTLLLEGMSGFDFYLAYPTFEGYKISQYMRSYLLTCPVIVGARATSPPFFYNFPYLPLQASSSLIFLTFPTFPSLTSYQIYNQTHGQSQIPCNQAIRLVIGNKSRYIQIIAPCQTFSAKWTAEKLESIHD